ncbi:MAG: hypothetical protein IPN79_07725 [Saprospiraceae bacterium]|nr:hypothetical protein [Saprospiraceae bacterium]
MLVSNFEILVNRFGPALPTPEGAVFRRIVQGYFLTVTNLEPKRTLYLYAKMTTTSATGNRALSPSNLNCLFDNGMITNFPKTIGASITYSPSGALMTSIQSFTLAPKETCLLAFLPKTDPLILQNTDVEYRGYVELFQTFSLWKKPSAQLLVTPEYRGTYLDNAFPNPNVLDELDFDQLAYSVPLASGQALNTVEAVKGVIWDFDFAAVKDISALSKALKIKNPDLDDVEINEAAEFVFNMKSDPDFLKQMKGK